MRPTPSLIFILTALTALAQLAGCTSPEGGGATSVMPTTPPAVDQSIETDACIPECGERQCGDDHCGGRCGECPEGELCTEDGECFRAAPPPSECGESCEAMGYECGEACGLSCGECSEGERCDAGRCLCQPDCIGKVCGADDGCGGVCAPCPNVESCTNCVARLSIYEETRNDAGELSAVIVALELSLDAEVLPEMADIRVAISGPARLQRVALGEPLVNSDKQLMNDPQTGTPFQVLEDGVHRFIILSTENSNPISAGRWLYLQLLIGDTAREGPIQLSLIKREQTLAPPEADQQLWRADYETPLVIWPEVRNED